MSISAMVDTKMIRERSASAPQGVPIGVDTGIVDQITRWIPSESLLLYVALLTAVDPVAPASDAAAVDTAVHELDYGGRWAALIVFVVVTVGLVIVLSIGRARSHRAPFRWPVFELFAAPLAFAAWAVALPDTPLLDFSWFNQAIGGFILLAATVLIAVCAYAFGKSPSLEKVVTT